MTKEKLELFISTEIQRWTTRQDRHGNVYMIDGALKEGFSRDLANKLISYVEEAKQEKVKEIVKDYGEFRRYRKDRGHSRTLRFFLLPHAELTEEDLESDY